MENESERIEELSQSILGDKKANEKVGKLVCFILEKEGKTDAEHTLGTTQILEKYAELKTQHPEIVNIPDGTISTMLSMLNNDSDSAINCPGKKQGYYVSLVQATPVDEGVQDGEEKPEEQKEQGSVGKRKANEKLLYPLVTAWLATKVDRVKDVSNLRGSTKWRNPDILGIDFKNLLGTEYIELVTIEVKPFMEGWQQYIFEAVSHYMFVHRSYFAFLHATEEKVPDVMKLYANQFGIGLLSIEFSKEGLDKFQKEGILPEPDDYDIIEIAPAVYHVPNIDLEMQYLDGLEIKNQTGLHEYGVSSKDL